MKDDWSVDVPLARIPTTRGIGTNVHTPKKSGSPSCDVETTQSLCETTVCTASTHEGQTARDT